MNEQEIKEQVEKLYPAYCPNKGYCTHNWCSIRLSEQNAFKSGAKWMQESEYVKQEREIAVTKALEVCDIKVRYLTGQSANLECLAPHILQQLNKD